MNRTKLSLNVLFFSALLIQSCKKEELRVITPDGNIETIAGMGPTHLGFSGDGGSATSAMLGWLTGLAVDATGNVYLSDGSSNVIRKITVSDGKITTIAGIFLGNNVVDPTPYFGDGGSASSAHVNIPLAVAVGAGGNVYIADAGNNVVRKILVSTGTITTFAGLGAQGYEGDGGPASSAKLFNPYSVAIDGSENLYIADSENHVIRKVSASTGIITTIAGNGVQGYQGDGGAATSANLFSPQGVFVDNAGNVYISDSGNNVIRKVTFSTGIITTIAGNGTAGYSGDGGPASSSSLSSPHGLAADAAGNLYIADAVNNVIRKVEATTSTMSTVAGNGVQGYSGDGGLATSANLFAPAGVALDGSGNLFIADGNSVIRKVTKP